MRGMGTPRSTGENFGCTWEHQGALAISLGALATSLGAPAISLGVPVNSLGAPRITVEQSGKTVFFWNTAGAAGNHSYYLSFNDY